MQLFTGLYFPDTINQKLASLRGTLPFIHWNKPESYHLTLCFIGEIKDYHLMNDLDLSLSQLCAAPFSISIETVNYFKSSSEVLNFWAGIQPSQELNNLQKKITRIIKVLGIQIPKRKFLPHITLAKGIGLSEEQIEKWLYHYNLFKTEPIQINHFSLFSSYPNQNDIHYEIEANYCLR